jgi:hypothetical protein
VQYHSVGELRACITLEGCGSQNVAGDRKHSAALLMLCSKRQRTGGAGAKPRSKLEEVMQMDKQAKSMKQAREQQQQQQGQQQQQPSGR